MLKNHFFAKNIQHLLAILAVVFSLAYAFTISPPLNVDAKAHSRIAVNIAAGHGYWEQFPPDKAFDRAIGRSGPLYEYFLAAIYKVAGVNIPLVWIIQALLHGLTVWLIFYLAMALFSSRLAAAAAAGLYGFHIDLLEGNAMLMTENTYLFLFVLSLALFIRYHAKPTTGRIIIFSLAFGLTFLAKSTVALAFLPFLIYLLARRRFAQAALSLFFIGLTITPWTIRNYKEFNIFMPTRLYGFYTLYVGNHHGASGENDIELLTAAKDLELREGVFALENYSKNEFFSFMKTYPLEYLSLNLKRVSIFFSFIRPTGHWPYLTSLEKTITFAWSGLFSFILITLGLAGLALAFLKNNHGTILRLLAVVTLLLPIPYLLTVIETRYRYPSYPLLAIFAGYAASLFWKEKNNKLVWPIASLTLFILTLNSIFDLAKNWQRFINLL